MVAYSTHSPLYSSDPGQPLECDEPQLCPWISQRLDFLPYRMETKEANVCPIVHRVIILYSNVERGLLLLIFNYV